MDEIKSVLTDEEIEHLSHKATKNGWGDIGFARAIERAVREATTQAKPVAYVNFEKRCLEWAVPPTWGSSAIVNSPRMPLYAAPFLSVSAMQAQAMKEEKRPCS